MWSRMWRSSALVLGVALLSCYSTQVVAGEGEEDASSECPSTGALSIAEQEAIAHAHNEIRNSTAEWRRKMERLYVSETLACVAAQVAETCVWQAPGEALHANCSGSLLCNMFGWRSAMELDASHPTEHWYESAKSFCDLHKTQPKSNTTQWMSTLCQPYEVMTRKELTDIGCGRASCATLEIHTLDFTHSLEDQNFLVCVYGIPTNPRRLKKFYRVWQ